MRLSRLRGLLLATLLTGCHGCDPSPETEKRYPTIQDGAVAFSEAWCTWNETCANYGNFDMYTCMVSSMSAICTAHNCKAEMPNADVEIDTCLADIYSSIREAKNPGGTGPDSVAKCTLYGDSFVPPTCVYLFQ